MATTNSGIKSSAIVYTSQLCNFLYTVRHWKVCSSSAGQQNFRPFRAPRRLQQYLQESIT